ncbi:hypothetical protein OG285_37070 (plasmid) [Streptomyces sp. NBC_01471]|uniref:hypothetical protein n=1 Tax=Streptomyces sp. NBC_01471 TaxID=2903879 RepID=UPI00324A7878
MSSSASASSCSAENLSRLDLVSDFAPRAAAGGGGGGLKRLYAEPGQPLLLPGRQLRPVEGLPLEPSPRPTGEPAHRRAGPHPVRGVVTGDEDVQAPMFGSDH